MGQLTVISVTGGLPNPFHSACHLEFDGPQHRNRWLGFGPSGHGKPHTTLGKVFDDDESFRLKHGITIRVNDNVLDQAGRATRAKYSTGMYLVGVRDCVSFSADMARACHLLVPLINMTPYGLIRILGVWNRYERLW